MIILTYRDIACFFLIFPLYLSSMRIGPFLVSAIITGGLIYVMNRPWGDKVPMPLGKFLSPQFGIWQNAERSDIDFSCDLKLDGLNGKAELILD
jgi:penicillin amidase